MANPESTMYPSLAAMSTREGVTEYLSTTFALADPAVFEALESFWQDPDRGIFRGPYLRVRLPFLPVPRGWENPLGWSPAGFRPYRHQARAFERLSTLRGGAQPTIVTTGTGSGKTEAFLLPLLDHARRARERGEGGVKAIILYPMNALVTDQARRIAGMVHADPALAAVTAGVYIGGEGTHTTMGPDHLVDVRAELRSNPPDILLTNYRMLDLLLLREADAPIWQASATSLTYVVLDEFHTYDGAQGTDVAMLLRRLGATLGVATPERPLGRICPVATSATLGSGSRGAELRTFAETVFGTPFDADSLVGEERHGVDEMFGELDYDLTVPDVADVLAAPLPVAEEPLSWQPLAQAVLGFAPADRVALGDALRRHILMRWVAMALSGDPLPAAEAVGEVARSGALRWGAAARSQPERAQEALLRFLALVSAARVVTDAGGSRPLVNVEVQVWIREVSRVLREVGEVPRFAWWSDGPPESDSHWLPAVYCRSCGSAGWQALATELGEAFDPTPTKIWQASLYARKSVRTIIPVFAGTPEAVRLDPHSVAITRDGDLPVMLTRDEKAADDQRCPACGADDAIRFIGTAVATLVSVGLTQLFGLPSVPESEKKTLVFTDSVQDAAHRAAFVEGRAFQFNFRSAVLRAVGDRPSTLPEVAERLADSRDEDLYVIAPPDFVRRLGLTGEYLSPDPGRARHSLLATRLDFQTHLEVGLRSRVGRTLELTGALGVHVDYDEASLTALARGIHQNLPVLLEPLPDDAYRFWIQGLLDRMRARGAVVHPWLEAYMKDDGKRWTIWGRSPTGMQKFPRGVSAPTFLTNRASEAFDSITSESGTWLNDWTTRCLGLPAPAARTLLAETVEAFAASAGAPIRKTVSKSNAYVYGLDPASLILTPVTDDDAASGRLQLTCPECHHVQPVSPSRAAGWAGSPCPRMRCTGRLVPARIRPDTFYRKLYRSGTLRRIVAEEHTGLLDRAEREAVETAFKAGTSPVAPNVLTCTPTLELGIDIGDLSSVGLSSLPRTPANYLQRVGRAGRSTGNALVLATVPSSPRDLYYFAEPRNLIAGEVVPPSAYLEATELLHRQYLAYCLDRAAAGDLPAALPGSIPRQLGLLFHKSLEEGTWLRALTDLLTDHADALADGFLALFADRLTPPTKESVRAYARSGVVEAVAKAAHEWSAKRTACLERLKELNAAIAKLQDMGHLDETQDLELRSLRSERRAQQSTYDSLGNQETLTGLSEISLLPNYNLVDDATTLDVALWWISDDHEGIQRAEHSYQRGSRLALTEFAPGATFYARGQKVTVDAVDPGRPADPAWTARRLCTSCGWGAGSAKVMAACPRCGDSAIADIGAVHPVLPFRAASAEHSRDEAVIDDDAESRSRRRYATVVGVDIDPTHVRHAWRLKDKAFGAEYAFRATVRSLNLGPLTDHGTSVSVAGERVVRSSFTTCGHCGKWWKDGTEPDQLRHRGWCPTRKGAAAAWVPLVLGHELTTQAVRMLLPVSVFHHTPHLVAMKGALLLGLRADFGGDPQHLDVVTASMPDEHGKPRRFLVLHDTVPGGTGYLDRIGDPDRLRTILVKARDHLASCPCRSEARLACHRCLLSVLGGSEIEHADRQLAVSLLDEILSPWEVEPIDSVVTIDITGVHLSELEKRFRQGIVTWAQRQGDAVALKQPMGAKGKELDLTFTRPDGFSTRWLVRPLVDVVAAGVATQPDFLAVRQDAKDCDVAVYLDGREFHASPAANRVGDDAVKRHALRTDGRRVWSITWDDVQHFERTLDPAAQGGKASYEDSVVPPAVQAKVLGDSTVSDSTRTRLLWGNPIAHLLSYLADPGSDVWEAGALTLSREAILAATSDPVEVAPAAVQDELVSLASGGHLPAAGPGSQVVAFRGASGAGATLVAFACRKQMAATWSLLCVLDDAEAVMGSYDHGTAWKAWLHWSNVAQFLPLPTYASGPTRRSAGFWTTSTIGSFLTQYVDISVTGCGGPGGGTAPATGPGGPEAALSPEWADVLRLVAMPIRTLVIRLAEGGVPPPEVGFEVCDGEYIVELAWPDHRVVVVLDADADRDAWLEEAGFRAFHVEASALAPANRTALDALAAAILKELKPE